MSSPEDRWRAAPETSDIVESAPREWPAARRRLGTIAAATATLRLPGGLGVLPADRWL
jgi:hypothetical protein